MQHFNWPYSFLQILIIISHMALSRRNDSIDLAKYIYMQQYHLPGSLHSTEIRILEEMHCLNPFTTLEHSGPILCRTRSTAISKLGHYPRIFHIWTEPLSNSPFLIFLCTEIKGASETEDFAFWSWITLLQQHRWNIRYKAVFLAKLQCYPE